MNTTNYLLIEGQKVDFADDRNYSIKEVERIYEEAYNCTPTEHELNALYTALIEQDTAYLW